MADEYTKEKMMKDEGERNQVNLAKVYGFQDSFRRCKRSRLKTKLSAMQLIV